MAGTKMSSVGSLQKGNYVVVEGVASKVADTQTSRPGKHGHAKVRLTAVGLIDGKKRVVVLPGHDNVEVPVVEKKTAQVLSINGDMANVMDSETYETFDLKIEDELKGQVASAPKEKMQGKVQVVMDVNKQKFKEGNILVTTMTRPDFVPLMKKASAIITDEGGITCHAAIVSRELGIPCIIGTKNATKTLKDSDEVEMDLVSGQINIVK